MTVRSGQNSQMVKESEVLARGFGHGRNTAGYTQASPERGGEPNAWYTRLAGQLHVAIWFALVASLGELAIRAIQKYVLAQRILLSPHAVWMIPLVYICAFVVVGLILGGAFTLWPKIGSLRFPTFLYTFMGLVGPLFAVPRLQRYAALLLAAGMAMQSARLGAAHQRAYRWLIDKTTFRLTACLAVLIVIVTGWEPLRERYAVATIPPAAPTSPNVLLIILDTVRAQNVNLYGYARPTAPHLQRLSENAVVYDMALSTSSWTLPAHASMFTGRYPHEVSADWLSPLDATFPTLAEVFAAHGYLTGGFVANVLYGTRETGLARGFIHYEDYPISWGMVVHSAWLTRILYQWLFYSAVERTILVHKTAAEVNHQFLSWLDRRRSRPFFAFLNYFDAHAPYFAPPPFDQRFGAKEPRAPLAERQTWTTQQIQVDIDAYDNTIAYLDHQVGLLVEELRRRGVLNDTLMIITSDHGELFGEHGLFDHANSLYRDLLHVPLLMSFPGHVPAGTRVAEPVTLRDLPATIMDLVPLRRASHFPGTSLTSHWAQTHQSYGPPSALLSEVSKGINVPSWTPVSRGNMKSLVMEGKHYIENGDGREELYDWEKDPEEARNLAASDEGRLALERLRTALTTVLRRRQPAWTTEGQPSGPTR